MRKQSEFLQNENLALWEVKLGKGQTEGRAIAAFDRDGNSLDWERSWFKDGTLYVDFGVDEHTGKLLYDYEANQSQDTISGHGGVINVNINQFNGGLVEDPVTFH